MIAILAGFPELAGRITERAPGPLEASIQTPTGRRVLEIAETPLTDWQHQVIGRLVVLHDITALRMVEAQLVEHERALAAAQERERLARELHDGLAQDLWLAKLKATRLAAEPELSAEVQALTGEIAGAVDAGIAEARDAVAALRASNSGGRFQDVLERSLQQFEDRFGLRVDANCEPDLPVLSARAEAEVLRIVHEALTNVRRHADATVVRVRAALEDGRFVLEVRDNGRGFDQLAAGDWRVRSRGHARARVAHRRGARDRVGAPPRSHGAPAGAGFCRSAARARGSAMTATAGSHRIRVMIVDDHPLVRAAVRESLAESGLDVVGDAASAEEALSVAPHLRPDVLLVDIDLPGMDGVALVRELAPRLPEHEDRHAHGVTGRSPPARCDALRCDRVPHQGRARRRARARRAKRVRRRARGLAQPGRPPRRAAGRAVALGVGVREPCGPGARHPDGTRNPRSSATSPKG